MNCFTKMVLVGSMPFGQLSFGFSPKLDRILQNMDALGQKAHVTGEQFFRGWDDRLERMRKRHAGTEKRIAEKEALLGNATSPTATSKFNESIKRLQMRDERRNQRDAKQVEREKEHYKVVASRVNEDVAKQLMKVQQYWPEIKKELENSGARQDLNSCIKEAGDEINEVGSGASGLTGVSDLTDKSWCTKHLKLIFIMFHSLTEMPNQQITAEFKPYAYRYLVPMATEDIRRRNPMASAEASEKEAQEGFDANWDTWFGGSNQ
jgi:Zn-dependent M32 family carboxypeptidase